MNEKVMASLREYSDRLRPALLGRPRAPVRHLDLLADRLSMEASRPATPVACFVGDRQVGKTTLVDAVRIDSDCRAGAPGPSFTADVMRVDSGAGLDLVDLPGLGVVDDEEAQLASQLVQGEADIVVVVVPEYGISERVAAFLDSTGVKERLLGGSEAAPPVEVIVVVTHLDDSVKASIAVSATRTTVGHAPDRREIFTAEAGKVESKIRAQLREALRQSTGHADPGGEGPSGVDEARIGELANSVDVLCVCAPEYLNLSTPGLGDHAWLQEPEVTGVPRLRDLLSELRDRLRQQRVNYVHRLHEGFREAVDAGLEEGAGLDRRRGHHA